MADVLTPLALLAILTMTPGPDTFLTLRQATTLGRDAALWSALGISTGTLVHATLAGLGVSVLLAKSPTAFNVVKSLGAVYLVVLGVRSLWGAWKAWRRPNPREGASVPPAVRGGASYRDGLLVNLLNPKVAVFYVAFIPQFIASGDPALGYAWFYGLSHAAMGLAWLSLVAVGAARLRAWLARPARAAAAEAAGAGAFLWFGWRLARSTA